MFLQRLLVIRLEKYRVNQDKIFHRNEYVEEFCKNWWPRLRYFYYNNDQYRRFVDGELGDCIRGSFEYMAEDTDQKGELLITTRGREFIKSLGFIEEFRKRRKRTTEMFLSYAFVAAITALIIRLWPWVNKLIAKLASV